jgi:putative transposase
MPRKRFTNEQIAFALRQAENGATVDEVCRKMGVSEPTFYRWKKQFVGMGVPEIRRLKQLEDENGKLKRLVADLTLDRSMLQDVLKDQWWGPPFAVRSRVIYRWPTTSVSVGLARPPASAVRPSATGSEPPRVSRRLFGLDQAAKACTSVWA